MKIILCLLLFLSSCKSIIFAPTGFVGPDGMGYIYQSVNRKGEPNKPPVLYFCDGCTLELRGKKVYITGTNEEIK